jgi:3-methylfumaryl-CoA hydratase
MSDTTDFSAWIGKSEEMSAHIAAYAADAMTATLDRDDPPFAPGDPLPPNWHLFYTREVVKLSATGPDGHPKRGDFVPPMEGLPRRMWAGTKSEFFAPLRIGDDVTRVSTIESVTPKEGQTGKLCFVTVRHDLSNASGLCVTERHTSVYREAATPGEAPPVPPAPKHAAKWHRDVTPSAVLLFRFSALTMNSHRIHYDWKYVTETEGYPGLLVHGPLTQTLLFDLFRREYPDATLKSFDVRAISPLYDTHDFAVEGAPGEEPGTAHFWAINHEGRLAMSAEAKFEG